MFSKTETEVQVEEGTYYQDPFTIGGKATLHYYGGYMAFSTKAGDFVSGLKRMEPYIEYEKEQVLLGYTDHIIKTREPVRTGERAPDGTPEWTWETEGRTVVHKEPSYKTVLHDVTPPYVPFGQEIKAGDLVEGGGWGNVFGGTRTVEAINDSWIQVDGMYIPWSLNVALKRVTPR